MSTVIGLFPSNQDLSEELKRMEEAVSPRIIFA